MVPVWIAYSAVLCCLANLAVSDKCDSYSVVEQQNEKCRVEADLSIIAHGNIDGSRQMMTWLQEDCSKVANYYACMDDFISGCRNEELLRREVRNSMNYCNGNQLANWVKGLLPLFDHYNLACVYRFPVTNYCSTYEDKYYALYPFTKLAKPTLDGLATMRALKSGYLACTKDAMETEKNRVTTCGGKTWQMTYVSHVLNLHGLSGDRPLGWYLDASDVRQLETLAVENNGQLGLFYR